MSEVAKDHNLTILKTLNESSSGSIVVRPVFNQMIEIISRNEDEGIKVWKLSRLSRNSDDAGKIMSCYYLN